MLCFFIVALKAYISLKHLDYRWPSYPQKLQCLSTSLLIDFVSLSPLGVGAGWESLGPLFCLLLQGCCFFGCLNLSFCCDIEALLDVHIVLITSRCKSLSWSLIRESQKASRVSVLQATSRASLVEWKVYTKT
jgi:hypothetical protein